MNILTEIYILDLVGTFAFAVYGSYFALKKNFDTFGIFTCAILTAVGGGTLRELVANNIPFYFLDMNYLYIILIGIFTTIYLYNHFERIKKYAIFLDSVGLVTFAYIGASKADEMGLSAFAIILFATLTAVGGGALRDIAINKVPNIFYEDFYASIAVLVGVSYVLLREYMQTPIVVNLILVLFLMFRLLAIKKNIVLWRPIKDKQKCDTN